eukprot:tig00021537_g22320.t1
MGCAPSAAGHTAAAASISNASKANSASVGLAAGDQGGLERQLASALTRIEEAERRASAAERKARELQDRLDQVLSISAPGPAGAPAARSPRFDVYVSSAPEDAAAVERYVRRIREDDLSVCLRAAGVDGMACSAAVVMFVSDAWLASAACDADLQRAHHDLRLPKLPVFLAPPAGLRLPAEHRMMLTAVNWIVPAGPGDAAADAACDALLQGLRALRAPARPPPAAPAAPASATPPRRSPSPPPPAPPSQLQGPPDAALVAPAAAPEPPPRPAPSPAGHPTALPPLPSPAGGAAHHDDRRFDLFISYAHRDAAGVFGYVAALEAAGLSVWIDRELVAGRRWMEDIAEAMKRSRGFVCFLSPAYAESSNCDDEFQFAHHHLKLLKFPVFLADPTAFRLRADQQMAVAAAGGRSVVQAGGAEEAPGEAAAALVGRVREAFAEEERRGALRGAQAEALRLALDEAGAALAQLEAGRQREAHERWAAVLEAAARKGGALLVDARGGPRGVPGLAEAAAMAEAGETLLVAPGLYREHLLLERPASLLAAPGALLACDAATPLSCRGPVAVSVTGLAVRGESGRHPAVRARGGCSLTLVECEVGAAAAAGALGAVCVEEDETRAHLARCLVRGCAKAGVVFTAGARGSLEACDVSECGGDGVLVQKGAEVEVTACRVHACRGSGVVAEERARGAVRGCELFGHGRGGVELRTGAEVEVAGNTIRGCAFFGVSAYVEARGAVEGNDVHSNAPRAPAVQISKKARPLVRNNRIHDQALGIQVFAGGLGTIEGNVFEGITSPAHADCGGVRVYNGEPLVRDNVFTPAPACSDPGT